MGILDGIGQVVVNSSGRNAWLPVDTKKERLGCSRRSFLDQGIAE
jgi:hypothetical protein